MHFRYFDPIRPAGRPDSCPSLSTLTTGPSLSKPWLGQWLVRSDVFTGVPARSCRLFVSVACRDLSCVLMNWSMRRCQPEFRVQQPQC